MGLFSGIKNVFKKVLRGIGKIFKPVVEFVGKLTQKKWFKWLMIGAMVFTAGVALYAGIQGFTAAGQVGQTLMGQFVTGAKEFMTALMHPISTANDILTGARTVDSVASGLKAMEAAKATTDIAQATGVSSAPVDAITGQGVTTQGAGAAPQAVAEGAYGTGAAPSGAQTMEVAGGAAGPQMGPPAPPVPTSAPAAPPISGSEVLNSAVTPGTQGPMTGMFQNAGGGTAGRVVGGMVEFAKTTGGGLLLGNLLQGYGAGQAEEEYWKRQDQIRALWNDPEEVGKIRQAAQRRIPVPGNYMANAVTQPWNIRRHYGYPQTVGGPAG